MRRSWAGCTRNPRVRDGLSQLVAQCIQVGVQQRLRRLRAGGLGVAAEFRCVARGAQVHHRAALECHAQPVGVIDLLFGKQGAFGYLKDFSAPLKELFGYYQSMEDVRIRYEEVRRFLLLGDAMHRADRL